MHSRSLRQVRTGHAGVPSIRPFVPIHHSLGAHLACPGGGPGHRAAQQLADADPAGGRKRNCAWPAKMRENGSSDARAAGQHSSRPLGAGRRCHRMEVSQLSNPERLWSAQDVACRPSPVPRSPGVYAWYFRQAPPQVPLEGCIEFDGHRLLYIGITPRRPSTHAVSRKRSGLRGRIRTHYRGDADRSTLRRTLGCLLKQDLGIHLAPMGGSHRLDFGEGETALTQWMASNAKVVWMLYDSPWQVEPEIISLIRPPLNLQHNHDHPFHSTLSAIRAQCIRSASKTG